MYIPKAHPRKYTVLLFCCFLSCLIGTEVFVFLSYFFNKCMFNNLTQTKFNHELVLLAFPNLLGLVHSTVH